MKLSWDSAQRLKQQIIDLENEHRLMGSTINVIENLDYLTCKVEWEDLKELDDLYEKKANNLREKSKCDWYVYDEKWTISYIYLAKSLREKQKIKLERYW